MRKLGIAFFGALSASITALACGSSAESGTDNHGIGNGSTSGVDGGDGASTGASGFGGDVAGGGFGSGSANAGGAGQGGAGSGGVTSRGGSTATQGGPIGSVTPVGAMDPVCSNQSVAATASVLDVFIMLDRSQSMTDAAAGGTKWEVITDAIDTFVGAPESATMNAGIGFFGITSGGNKDSSCTAGDYAKPVVPIAQLGGTAANAAKITSAIGMTKPGTNTPTEPALQGAIDYASTWAKQHPTHKVVVVFATDGLPNGCNSTVAGAAKIAAAGAAANPSIQTYVIGVFGDKDCPGGVTKGQTCMVVSNTNQIAKGGGTGSAFIVNASASTGAQFLSALNAIRTANQVGCDFKVAPPAKGKAIDFARATVRYTPGTGAAQNLAWHASAAQCAEASGFYYDNVTSPSQILLCGGTCKAVSADPGAKIDMVLACEPPGTTTGGGGAGNGTGGTGTGVGGATGTAGGSGSGGAGSGAGGAGSCLLAGQSCQSAAECCGGLCTDGVCASNVR